MENRRDHHGLLRWTLAFAVLGLYVTACWLPAIRHNMPNDDPQGMPGIQVLTKTPFLFTEEVGEDLIYGRLSENRNRLTLAWLANVFLLLGWVSFLRRDYTFAAVMGIVSVALLPFTILVLRDLEYVLQVGGYLWIASILLFAAGSIWFVMKGGSNFWS